MSRPVKYDRDAIAKAIVEVIAAATEVGGFIDTQEELTGLVRDHMAANGVDEESLPTQGVINILMYRATARSKKLYPGKCIQKTYVYGYRITDRQLWEEIKVSRGRVAASITKKVRAIAEMEVKHRGPEARTFISIQKASLKMDQDALEELDKWIVAEA